MLITLEHLLRKLSGQRLRVLFVRRAAVFALARRRKRARRVLAVRALRCLDAPAHYKQGEVECIDAMESAFGKERLATYCTINAMKYLWRANEHEDGVERSLRKASWYIHKALQLSRTSQPATPRVNDGNVGWEKY